MRYLIVYFLLFTALGTLGNTYIAHAQNSSEVYGQAIDNINCATIKLLLIGYDRPGAAQLIKTCDYNSIASEVEKVQENQVKGYKSLFLKLAGELSDYKAKLNAGSTYEEYAISLEEAGNYAVEQFKAICQKNQRPDNSVCVRLSQKVLSLESDINSITDKALVKINTNGNEPAETTTDNNTEPTTTTENEEDRRAEESPEDRRNRLADPEENALETETAGKSGFSWLWTVLFIALLAALAWLYKEYFELKDEFANLKSLMQVLRERDV